MHQSRRTEFDYHNNLFIFDSELMNKYLLTFTSQDLENRYQKERPDFYRSYMVGIIFWIVYNIYKGLLIILVDGIYAYQSLYYVTLVPVCFVICIFTYFNKNRLRTTSFICNHVMMTYQLTVTESHDQYLGGVYVLGGNIMIIHCISLLLSDFRYAFIESTNLFIVRVIIAYYQKTSNIYLVALSTLGVYFILISVLYMKDKTNRLNYLLAVKDSQYEIIIPKLMLKQYALFTFDATDCIYKISSSNAFSDEKVLVRFLRDAKVVKCQSSLEDYILKKNNEDQITATYQKQTFKIQIILLSSSLQTFFIVISDLNEISNQKIKEIQIKSYSQQLQKILTLILKFQNLSLMNNAKSYIYKVQTIIIEILSNIATYDDKIERDLVSNAKVIIQIFNKSNTSNFLIFPQRNKINASIKFSEFVKVLIKLFNQIPRDQVYFVYLEYKELEVVLTVRGRIAKSIIPSIMQNLSYVRVLTYDDVILQQLVIINQRKLYNNFMSSWWNNLRLQSQVLIVLLVISFLLFVVLSIVDTITHAYLRVIYQESSKVIILEQNNKSTVFLQYLIMRNVTLILNRSYRQIRNANHLFQYSQQLDYQYIQQPKACLNNASDYDSFGQANSVCYGFFGSQSGLDIQDYQLLNYTALTTQLLPFYDNYVIYFANNKPNKFQAQYRSSNLTNYDPQQRPWYTSFFRNTSQLSSFCTPYYSSTKTYVIAQSTGLSSKNGTIIGVFASSLQLLNLIKTTQWNMQITLIDSKGLIYSVAQNSSQIYLSTENYTGFNQSQQDLILNQKDLMLYNSKFNQNLSINTRAVWNTGLVMVFQSNPLYQLELFQAYLQILSSQLFQVFREQLRNRIVSVIPLILVSVLILLIILKPIQKLTETVRRAILSQKQSYDQLRAQYMQASTISQILKLQNAFRHMVSGASMCHANFNQECEQLNRKIAFKKFEEIANLSYSLVNILRNLIIEIQINQIDLTNGYFQTDLFLKLKIIE